MKLFASAVLAALLLSSPASAQVDIDVPPVRMVAECISAAIANDHVKKSGESVEFLCHGLAAQRLFNDLRSFSRTDTTSQFRKRYFNTADMCWQTLETSGGNATSGFGCRLNLTIGAYLNR